MNPDTQWTKIAHAYGRMLTTLHGVLAMANIEAATSEAWTNVVKNLEGVIAEAEAAVAPPPMATEQDTEDK